MCRQTNADYHDENVRVVPNKCGTNVDEIDEECSPNRNTTNVWNVDINKINDCILLSSARHDVMKLWSIAQRMLNWKERIAVSLLHYNDEAYEDPNEPNAAEKTIITINRIWSM